VQREKRVWLGFVAVVIAAVLFVVSRDDDKANPSQLSAGTTLPTSTVSPPTTITAPTTTSSSSTTTPSTTTTSTGRAGGSSADTVADTRPPTTSAPVTTPPTAPPTTQPPLRVQFGPGTYRIGIDLPAGTYRTEGGQDCFWVRLSSLSGTADSVIAGDHTEGAAATVVVVPGDTAFSTAGCAAWVSA